MPAFSNLLRNRYKSAQISVQMLFLGLYLAESQRPLRDSKIKSFRRSENEGTRFFLLQSLLQKSKMSFPKCLIGNPVLVKSIPYGCPTEPFGHMVIQLTPPTTTYCGRACLLRCFYRERGRLALPVAAAGKTTCPVRQMYVD